MPWITVTSTFLKAFVLSSYNNNSKLVCGTALYVTEIEAFEKN